MSSLRRLAVYNILGIQSRFFLANFPSQARDLVLRGSLSVETRAGDPEADERVLERFIWEVRDRIRGK